ncbi:terminase large subunit domain-containing protein [Mameliella alba]|uniref:terminase large subunit domain-containing protein n=1 Tax=Mameliella alba TaxID=561184 RepID=UPI000B52D875|nr:terminase large subunit [Mameliella alba]OWV40396.1 terminase [Mameliella alba]
MAAQVEGGAWSTAVPDWEERLLEGRSLVPDLPLFEASAEKALRIFKRLKVPDLYGTPTYGEVCEEWVFDFVRAVFGSYDPETRKRMISEFFLLIPKKNGKSAIAAAIIVTAAILNDRPENELILIAPTQKIAGIAFKQAMGIIKLDPVLGGPDGFGREGGIFKTDKNKHEITHQVTGAVIRILSADGDVVTGSKAAFILVDESHVLLAKAKAADIMIELRGGLASRPEGFLLQITTQSKDRPTGEFEKQLNTARAVRDGTLEQPLLAVLYELPQAMAEKEAWRDPATWGLVNPNLGVSVDEGFLLNAFRKAEDEGIEAVAKFASQHLNVQVGLGLKSGRWLGADYWLGAKREEITLEHILETSEVLVGGLDGGGLDDLLGFALIGRHAKTKRWQAWARAWADRAVLGLRPKIKAELEELEASGDLILVDSLEDANLEIAALCRRIYDLGLFPEKAGLGFDAYGVSAILDALEAEGLDGEHVVAVGQGYKLKGAIQSAPVMLKNGRLVHGGQRLMTWCVGNARVRATTAAVMMDKSEAGSAKIDPVIALLNAFQLMAMHPQAAPRRDLSDVINNMVMHA